ncbi:hypothetical protein CC78DRAFT_1263 [Lojkania enalia]|uniref:Mitochondrial outer membrane transport complex Sam37/metaxin N-terminal domain-containing protein n=1 Tax=Lojkania enalia TaxID=147567 RepID=A0A9P4NCN0_9PLEO|nr:hypothetical protein CC78DRAFT_1263 [Didymosphaeria enalia]
MVLELYVWGPAFGLPSIDAECIATIAYFQRIVPHAQWILISDYDTSISPREEFPALIDGNLKKTGFSEIITHLRSHCSGAYDLDYHLTQEQQTDRTAFTSFLQSIATPLIDLYLYVSSENYYSATTSAYTAILPWYKNYTIPPTRRDLARARTSHQGLSSLDINAAGDDSTHPGSGTSGSEFEAAKRAAGLPSGNRATLPNALNLGRGKGIRGIFNSPIYAVRFKLDALINELLEPLLDLLGKKDYLLDGSKPSSLDCIALGFLSLMLYPDVPQAWLKEAIQTRFPRLLRYIRCMREELLGGEEVQVADVWLISHSTNSPKHSLRLPWHPSPSRTPLFTIVTTAREVTTKLPLLSALLRPAVTYQIDDRKLAKSIPSSLPSPLFINSLCSLSVALAAALVGAAISHRRSPRSGDLVFQALRPNLRFGEAGNVLSVLAYQLPKVPASQV